MTQRPSSVTLSRLLRAELLDIISGLDGPFSFRDVWPILMARRGLARKNIHAVERQRMSAHDAFADLSLTFLRFEPGRGSVYTKCKP